SAELAKRRGPADGLRREAIPPDVMSNLRGNRVAELAAVRVRDGHTRQVLGVDFSPDGATLASAGDDRVIKLWDVASTKVKATLTGHRSSVASVRFSPDGQVLASCGQDGVVKLWDVAAGQERQTLAGHPKRVYKVGFSGDGRVLAAPTAE